MVRLVNLQCMHTSNIVSEEKPWQPCLYYMQYFTDPLTGTILCTQLQEGILVNTLIGQNKHVLYLERENNRKTSCKGKKQ